MKSEMRRKTTTGKTDTLRKIHLLGMVAQFSSSDLSGQSGTPSQTRELSKQIPSRAHRNCSGGHWYTKQNQQKKNNTLIPVLTDAAKLI